MKTKPIRQCALCLEEKELRESHILPRFLRKLMELSTEKSINFAYNDKLGNYNRSESQDFPKEFLLCNECEGIFNKYETKVSNFYYKEFSQSPYVEESSLYRINYSDIHFFIISILWRCSISNLDYFKYINLGKYQEIFRQYLLIPDSIEYDDFPIYFFDIRKINDDNFNNIDLRDILLGPEQKKFAYQGNRYFYSYKIIIYGIMYLVIITQNQKFQPFLSMEEGMIKIFKGNGDKVISHIQSLFFK